MPLFPPPLQALQCAGQIPGQSKRYLNCKAFDLYGGIINFYPGQVAYISTLTKK